MKIGTIIAIDPGKTCGWTVGKYSESDHESEQQLASFGEDLYEDFLEVLWLDMVLHKYDRMVVERFVPRRIDSDSQETIEVIGALKFMHRHFDIPLGMVNASDKRKTQRDISDSIKGRHARDAEAIRLWDYKYGNWRNWH